MDRSRPSFSGTRRRARRASAAALLALGLGAASGCFGITETASAVNAAAGAAADTVGAVGDTVAAATSYAASVPGRVGALESRYARVRDDAVGENVKNLLLVGAAAADAANDARRDGTLRWGETADEASGLLPDAVDSFKRAYRRLFGGLDDPTGVRAESSLTATAAERKAMEAKEREERTRRRRENMFSNDRYDTFLSAERPTVVVATGYDAFVKPGAIEGDGRIRPSRTARLQRPSDPNARGAFGDLVNADGLPRAKGGFNTVLAGESRPAAGRYGDFGLTNGRSAAAADGGESLIDALLTASKRAPGRVRRFIRELPEGTEEEPTVYDILLGAGDREVAER